MVFVKNVPFEFEGKNYEVKIFQNGSRYTVRAFLNEVPANGYEYSVEETTNFDIWHYTDVSGVSHLIETAQADIKNKVWERYLAALEALKKDAKKANAQ